jgi:transcriptional regulator with XRE-family HTH domain
MERLSIGRRTNKELLALGIAIRAARKEKCLSQEALADEAGIDRSHMGRIERGERNVTVLNILRVAKALKCSVSELFGRAGI